MANFPTTHNYELRVMDLYENDEEDLDADAEELFGSNAAIDLDPKVQGLRAYWCIWII